MLVLPDTRVKSSGVDVTRLEVNECHFRDKILSAKKFWKEDYNLLLLGPNSYIPNNSNFALSFGYGLLCMFRDVALNKIRKKKDKTRAYQFDNFCLSITSNLIMFISYEIEMSLLNPKTESDSNT